MKTDGFDYQGKRPDQVAHSQRTAGWCMVLLVLAALIGFLTACGRSPTAPEPNPPGFVAIIERIGRADTLTVIP